MIFYAGIGPRDVEPMVRTRMTEIANCKRGEGHWLRSGHSGKSDLAFERGAYASAHIFLPWKGFLDKSPEPAYGVVVFDEPTRPAFKMAEAYHPAWGRCERPVRALLARNCHIILGIALDDPVQEVITWTPNGSIDGLGMQGGTAHALRVAAAHDVKVYNLRRPEHRAELHAKMWLVNGDLDV